MPNRRNKQQNYLYPSRTKRNKGHLFKPNFVRNHDRAFTSKLIEPTMELAVSLGGQLNIKDILQEIT